MSSTGPTGGGYIPETAAVAAGGGRKRLVPGAVVHGHLHYMKGAAEVSSGELDTVCLCFWREICFN